MLSHYFLYSGVFVLELPVSARTSVTHCLKVTRFTVETRLYLGRSMQIHSVKFVLYFIVNGLYSS